MAWNEPGGGKNPWGKQEGPPDLDQVFRKFQEKIGAALRGGGGSLGSGSSIGILLVVAVVFVLYVAAGFYIVQPAERAVITRFGKYNRTVGQGPHWIPKFIEDRNVVNVERISSSRHTGSMLTGDENIVSVDIEVQYRIVDPEHYLFQVVNPDLVLKESADSSLRQVIGSKKLDFVMTAGRAEMRDQILKNLEEILAYYNTGIQVTNVNVNEVKAPEPVKVAFDDVINARENMERIKHTAEGYANKVVPKAKGQAAQMLLEAEAYKQEVILQAEGETQKFKLVLPEYLKAPKVTRTRLYLEAMEEVLSRSSKVFLDMPTSGNGGNSLVYLPIDRLMQQALPSLNEESSQISQPNLRVKANASTNDDLSQDRRRRG